MEISHLQSCLEDCKERIFAMQSVEHMTDCQLTEQYVALRDSVSDWADVQFGQLDNPLCGINGVMGGTEAAEVAQVFLLRKDRLDVARTYPTSGCIVLTSLIHSFLHWEEILHEKASFPGIGQAWEDLLAFLEDGLRSLRPARGEPSRAILAVA
jgi:hypothetical protein